MQHLSRPWPVGSSGHSAGLQIGSSATAISGSGSTKHWLGWPQFPTARGVVRFIASACSTPPMRRIVLSSTTELTRASMQKLPSAPLLA